MFNVKLLKKKQTKDDTDGKFGKGIIIFFHIENYNTFTFKNLNSNSYTPKDLYFLKQ